MARSPRVRIFLVFAAAYFLSYSFRSVGAIIAPDLAHELQLNPRELGLLASVYFLTFFLALRTGRARTAPPARSRPVPALQEATPMFP